MGLSTMGYADRAQGAYNMAQRRLKQSAKALKEHPRFKTGAWINRNAR